MQAIEYLIFDALEPLDPCRPKECQRNLVGFVDLYDLSVCLEIDKLEQAIVDHINGCAALDMPSFVGFAAECYNGHKITEDSLLGQCIKTKLAQNLPILIKSGLIDWIKNKGGILNKQLVEVFAENFIETQKKKQGVKWKGRAVQTED